MKKSILPRQFFRFRQGKGIAAAEAGDTLAQVAVEGGVGVDEGLWGGLLGVTDEGGEFGPFLVFEAHVDFLLLLQEMTVSDFW